MRGKKIRLSPMRRFCVDLLHAAAAVPTVPVQRRMRLAEVVRARQALPVRPSWPAIFLKAYDKVTRIMPELRRVYVKLPWPHLYEYPLSVAIIAVEREHCGAPEVFFGRVRDPGNLPLAELSRLIKEFKDMPLTRCKEFRRAIWLSRMPWLVRRCAWWLGLNIGRQRANFFGTFGLSVYGSLGADSLHPLAPATTTLNYGPIAPDGTVDVRIIYDHRVMNGTTIARALQRLEAELMGDCLAELRTLPSPLAA